MSYLKLYNKAKENVIQEYNNLLNGKSPNTFKLMYEYLDPDNHISCIDFIPKEDYEAYE